MATATKAVTQNVTHLFDRYESAIGAVRELEASGVPSDDISMIGKNGEIDVVDETDETSGAATGAGIGTALGAGAGLLTGLGIMAIPGVGPVVAAGWLATTAVGAAAGMAAGGIIGALTDSGVSEADAHVYAEGVKRGGTVVSVRTGLLPHSEIVAIMQRHEPVNAELRGDEYRAGGWNTFDERAEEMGRRDRVVPPVR